ncbi:MAG: phosphopantetheine-binding protein [Planctomycetota bacterium]
MADRTTLESRIKELIVERLQLDGLTPNEIETDTPLFEGGLGLDSVDALELVLGLEQEFNIKVESDQIEKNTLMNVASIAAFVEGRGAPGAHA